MKQLIAIILLGLTASVAVFPGTPKKATCISDGILDLDGVDLRKPVRVGVRASGGHFTEVMLPTGFDPNSVAHSNGITFAKRPGPGRAIFCLFPDRPGAGPVEVVSVLDKDGKAVVLQVVILGHNFGSNFPGGEMPEHSGPVIHPLGPFLVMSLAQPKPTFKTGPALLDDANRFNGTLANEVHASFAGGDEDVTLPRGTAFIGCRDSAGGYWVESITLPDGRVCPTSEYVANPKYK